MASRRRTGARDGSSPHQPTSTSPHATSTALPSGRDTNHHAGNGDDATKRDATEADSVHSVNSASTTASSSTSSSADGLPRQIVLERTTTTTASSKAKRPRLGLGALGSAAKAATATTTPRRTTSYRLKAPGTPWHELDLSEIPWLSHHQPDDGAGGAASARGRGLTRYRRLFFLLGALLGAAVAWLVARHASTLDFRSLLDDQLAAIGVTLDGLPHLDLSLRVPRELADLGDSLFKAPSELFKTRDFQVGRRMREQGLDVHHPVVIIPGIVSTGLESWSTNEDSASLFRKRLWGTSTMMRTIVFEKEAWIRQISLDPFTGLDPPGGYRVRAAEGIDSASHFVAGFWIWSKIVENLAVLGYDTNTLFLASYDWRLSYHNLEVRDKYFSRLKARIEHNKLIYGRKSVIVAHSMGSSVALHFFKWAEASGPGYGNGGKSWVNDHIETFTSIAGTLLGVPKAMAALLSGEMRDTAELPPPAAYLLERFFSRRERAQLFRTWAGSASMLIKGGEAVWGNETWAPDDLPDARDTHGLIYSFRRPRPASRQHAPEEADLSPPDPDDMDGQASSQPAALLSAAQSANAVNLTARGAETWLMQHTPTWSQRMVKANYSNGIEYDEGRVRANDEVEQTWSNPLESALPNAPDLKILCLYGVGKPTERSYVYVQGPYERDETSAVGGSAQCVECGGAAAPDEANATTANANPSLLSATTPNTPLEFPTGRTGWIDTSAHDEHASPQLRAGCRMGEGDGTVSLLSLGAMCAQGWRRSRYNPGGARVVVHEIPHEPEASMDLRGGTTTGDHVDVLGNAAVNEAVLRVAAGRFDDVRPRYVSEIDRYARRIKWDGP